jgi:hypothetical protein
LSIEISVADFSMENQPIKDVMGWDLGTDFAVDKAVAGSSDQAASEIDAPGPPLT